MKERTRENWAAALRSGAIMAALIISVVALLLFTNSISYVAGALTCEGSPSLQTEVIFEDPAVRYRDGPT